MEATNMELDQESLYALTLFRALPPGYQRIAMQLLAELQQKTVQTHAYSQEEGETE